MKFGLKEMNTNLSEHKIQELILDWLKLNGYFVWRNNVGFKGHVHYGLKGSSDILGIATSDKSFGRFLAIEVKDHNGVVSEEQQKFIDAVNDHGGIAFVARSLGEVVEYLK